jgi:Cu/Ag efflux protein CusF
MRSPIACMALLAAMLTAGATLAQTGIAVERSPGAATAKQTLTLTGTVTAIDPGSRAVTLKGASGREITLTAAPDAEHFAGMKVGDRVTARYFEALTLELRMGGMAIVGRTEMKGVAPPPEPGERPAAVMGRQVTITADVTAVDAATQTVTLKGPKQSADLRVRDPEQFKLIKVGDQVEANYIEAVATSFEPAVAGK